MLECCNTSNSRALGVDEIETIGQDNLQMHLDPSFLLDPRHGLLSRHFYPIELLSQRRVSRRPRIASIISECELRSLSAEA